MQVFVSHNIRIRGASTPLRGAVMKALTIDNPAYIERKMKRRPTYGIDRHIQLFVHDRGDLVVPRGFLAQLREILAAQGITLEKVAVLNLQEGRQANFGRWDDTYQLRDYQKPAVEAARAANGVLVAPAGSGKTLMGLRYVYEKGRLALWLTHTKDLMYQAAKNAQQYMPEIGAVGIMGDGKQTWGNGNLIVATVQTLSANPELVEQLNPIVGTVIIDEAHHFPAPAFVEVAGKFSAVNMLGLTATPERKDKMEPYMYTGIGPKLHEVPRDALYDTGSLIKPDVQFVYTAFDYETASMHNENGSVDAGGDDMDYRAVLDALIADEARAKLIAETILDDAANNYSIVLTESVRYCYKLRDMVEQLAMSRYGVAPRMAVVHGPIDRYTWRVAKGEDHAERVVAAGEAVEHRYSERLNRWEVKVAQYTEEEYNRWNLSNKRRKELLEKGYAKEIDILFVTQLAREGLDMPHLTRGYSAMPKRGDAGKSKNGASVEQEIGRIMRRDPANPDKKAVWVDFVDYNVGVFKSQYMSRRSVYSRLGITLPKKPRTEAEQIEQWILNMPY